MASPADGATDRPLDSVLLDWQDSMGAASYNLFFGTTSPPPLHQSDLTASEARVGPLAAGTTYFWSVEAIASCGARAASGASAIHGDDRPDERCRRVGARLEERGGYHRHLGRRLRRRRRLHDPRGDLALLFSTGTYNHASRICTDAGGDLSETFTPAAGNRYYLVVPRTASGVEGDFGPDARRSGHGGLRVTGTSRGPVRERRISLQ